MARALRILALCLGYPLAVAVGLLLLAIAVRFTYIAVFDPAPAAEHLAEKREYLASVAAVDPARAPNFVVILFDDLGWGDLAVQGNSLIATPRIDRAAAEGLRMTHFYSASSVCTPSRASLLTGRYPTHAGAPRHVFFPDASALGRLRRIAGLGNELPRDEITLAEVLGAAGYATGMVGKWHLGERPGHRPTDFGFQQFYGVMWSNDMFPLHRYRNDEIIERDERPASLSGERDEERPLGPGGIDQSRLTADYTAEAIAFLEANRDRPFFLYLSHTFPHVPHYASPEHAGTSPAGLYGDVVEDLDRSTGAVLDALARLDLDERTLVVITSDNGADYDGSPGGLRGRKQETYEGGQRVPMIAHWPSRVPVGVTEEMAMNIDLFPTFLAMAGLGLPVDRRIDGRDLTALLTEQAESPHETLLYISAFSGEPVAVRDRRFKYLRSTGAVGRDRPHLSRLDADIEAHDLRRKHPDAARRLEAVLDDERRSFADNPRGWR